MEIVSVSIESLPGEKSAEEAGIIAVAGIELEQYGCPYCGYRSGYMPMSGGGAAVWVCGECNRSCCALGEGITESPIGFGEYHPKLQPHPRHGIPSHGRRDKQPEGGGEFFWPRGIGLDNTPGCFVCGGGDGLYNNVAAFVQCKAAGERVVGMFPHGARLDYREREPDRVQVKIGACDAHRSNLERLCDLVGDSGVITADHVAQATA